MSEFDLIDTTPVDTGSPASIEYDTQVGDAGVPVLSIKLHADSEPPAWPQPHELPGLRPLDPHTGASPFSHQLSPQQVTSLSWNGRPVLQSWGSPRLVPVDLDRLPGLKHRPGEQLPSGFGQAIRWPWALADNQRLYGLGQRSMPLERRGTAPCNWTTDEPTGHSRSTDPLYQAHPLLWGVTDGLWWAVFYLHSPYTRFDLGQERPDRMSWLSLGSSAQLQLHVAKTPAELHRSLRQVWETPTAPPLWSLGFHQSRWGYRSGEEVTKLVEEFDEREIPLDVIHLDIDHMENYRSFTFSKDRFPEPASLLQSFSERGVRVVTIVDPGLRFDPGTGYTPCDEGLAGNHFLKSVSGAPVVGYCWPDEALFPDFARAATRQWWQRQAAFYLDHGVSGLWIDMNEPAIFDKPFWSGGVKQLPMPLDTPGGEDERRFSQAALHNLYGSHMSLATHGTWEAREQRPWVLTRSGFTGVGRYAWSWMGDNTSWWEHLALSLPQLGSMGLVGSPFVGVDVGGFFGHCTPELYSAWIEASVIYPLMRAHSALDTRTAHPWSFGPEVEETARVAIRLRYRLLPYLYGVAMAQADGDAPWLRPMFFDFPDDDRFAYLEDQLMVGPHLMAAPFVVRGQNQRLVHLPKGVWYDLHTGHRYDHEKTVMITRRPGLVPLFARAGSVIPMLADDVLCTDRYRHMPWSLHVCPGDDQVLSSLYHDQGEGWRFEQGEFARMTLRLDGDTARIVSQEGNLTFPDYTVMLPTETGWHPGPPVEDDERGTSD